MLATADAKQPTYRARGLGRFPALPALRPHAPALTLLILAPFAIFGPGIVQGSIFYGKDTVQFYYPLTEWFFGELKRGTIPLWLPHIFGGYPLFADGEIGMAHPLVLLTGLLLPAEAAFTWLRGLHFSLAGGLAYWLASVLGVGRFGALIAGLVFAFSSFLVGHMQHDNILRSAVWLPALIALLELALRSDGARQIRYVLLAGLVLGVQCLGLHVQPVLISLLAAAGWIAVGPLGSLDARDDPGRRNEGLRAWGVSVLRGIRSGSPSGGWSRLARHATRRLCRVWMLGLMVAVGLSVAAVQLVPLVVLSGMTLRGAGVNYFVSTSYAVAPPELLTLLFPFFFRTGPDQHWSLWPPQETTVYFGIMPLLLAALAVICVRHRMVLWLVLATLAFLWLALGDYVTPNPYYWLWSLPGFSVMRAPARFTLVMALTVACLAGLGADWLARHYRPEALPVVHWRARGLLITWAAACLGLIGWGVAVRAALDSAPTEVMGLINLSYLTFRRELAQLGSPTVMSGLAAALDLSNPTTRLALVWMAASPIVLLAWTSLRRSSVLWQGLIVLIVAADLLSFAGAFYPQARPADLHARNPAIGELVARNGPHHVLLDPGLYNLVGANQLLPYGLSVAGGYSSLEPTQFMDYWWGMVRDENVLLDLFNVKYVAAPRRMLGSLMFNETRFHPAERLVNGGALNPAGSEQFRANGVPVDTVTVISAVEGLTPGWTGLEVAQITLVGLNGERRSLGLRYGMELTEYRAGSVPPSNARPAYAGPAFVPMARPFDAELYGAVLRVSSPFPVDQVTVRYTASSGTLLLHGLGLRDATSLSTQSLTSIDRVKYRTVYEGEDIVLLENEQALPKVFFATAAVPAEVPKLSAADLVATPHDLRNQLVIEPEHSNGVVSMVPGTHATTSLLNYGSDRLSASVSSTGDGFVVVGDRFDGGWRAWVDGAEAPVLPANGVLRAVPVPSGDHIVELRYGPWWVTASAIVSGLALVLVIPSLLFLRRVERRAASGRR